jgi:hypothetical protein
MVTGFVAHEWNSRGGTTYWKNQYVLGDYEITPIDEQPKQSLSGKTVKVELDGVSYEAVIK